MFSRISNKLSFFVIILYAVIAFTCRDSFRVYNHPENILVYDMGGYYSYLQGLFVYNDFEFKFIDNLPHQCMKVPVLNTEGDTVFINKYSMGPAILQAPFFFLGHLEAFWQQVPRDGASYTYLFWTLTGAIIYIIIALFLLRSILLRYYGDGVVASVLLAISLGTNLLYYTVLCFLMSHLYSFFLFSLAWYLVIRWIEVPKMWIFLFLSFVCALIALTRLPNMIFFGFIVFWGVHDKDSLLARLQLFKEQKKVIFLGIGVFMLCFIPQILYWHAITGKFYINAYYENGEYFYWTIPMITEVLIGYRKGWLIYTPIMIFGLLGLITLYKEKKEFFWTTFLFSIVNIYIVSCWSNWWYGGGFGMRALIEGSIVFSFPIASFFTYLSKELVVSYISSIIVAFLIFLNIFQSYQSHRFVLHHDAMTKSAYWVIVGVVPPVHDSCILLRDKHLKHPTNEETRRKGM